MTSADSYWSGPGLPFHDGFNWLCPGCDQAREMNWDLGVCVECQSKWPLSKPTTIEGERESCAQIVADYLDHPKLAGNELALHIIAEIATAIRSQP